MFKYLRIYYEKIKQQNKVGVKKGLMMYDEWSRRKPMKSSIISTGLIMGLGDLMMQYLEHKMYRGEEKFKLDKKRLMIISGYGFLLSGPMSGLWYNKLLPFLAPLHPQQNRNNLLKQLALKIFYDETIFSFITIFTFTFYSTYLHTFNYNYSIIKVQNDFLTIYKADLCCWPFVNFYVFLYIPYHLQPTILAIANIFWGAYLSYIQYKQ